MSEQGKRKEQTQFSENVIDVIFFILITSAFIYIFALLFTNYTL